jgi:hypothetical protein
VDPTLDILPFQITSNRTYNHCSCNPNHYSYLPKFFEIKLKIRVYFFFKQNLVYFHWHEIAILLIFFREIDIPLRKEIIILMGISIPNNRPLPNIVIPFQRSIPQTKRGLIIYFIF